MVNSQAAAVETSLADEIGDKVRVVWGIENAEGDREQAPQRGVMLVATPKRPEPHALFERRQKDSWRETQSMLVDGCLVRVYYKEDTTGTEGNWLNYFNHTHGEVLDVRRHPGMRPEFIEGARGVEYGLEPQEVLDALRRN